MERIEIGTQGFMYPMPMTLIGADLSDGPNFMPVAWINRVQMSPARLACGIGKNHATSPGIREHQQFGVSIPSAAMVAVVDWCGLESAARGADKAAEFTVVRGELEHAPMIEECPLTMECRLVQTVDLGTHELFIAEIVATWTEQRYLTAAGKPDVAKIQPFTLTMPDNRYWSVGEKLADAWSIGRSYIPGTGR